MLGFEWPDLSLQWPASFVSLASRRRMRSVRQHTWLISGLSVGFTLSMLSMRSLSPCEYADCGCLYCAFNTAMAIEPPCSIVCVFSKGEWEYANAYNVQPKDWVDLRLEYKDRKFRAGVPKCQLSHLSFGQSSHRTALEPDTPLYFVPLRCPIQGT